MGRLTLLAVSVLALVAGALLTTAATGSAHERRTVGAYNFVVGWLNEPALINEPNAIDLRVSRAADASAVTGLEQTLKGNGVEVSRREVGRDAEGGSRPCQSGPPPLVRMRVG